MSSLSADIHCLRDWLIDAGTTGLKAGDVTAIAAKLKEMSQRAASLEVSTTPAGGAGLYRSVRVGLMARGTTLDDWCSANGVKLQCANRALLGWRDDASDKTLRARLVAEALPQGAA